MFKKNINYTIMSLEEVCIILASTAIHKKLFIKQKIYVENWNSFFYRPINGSTGAGSKSS